MKVRPNSQNARILRALADGRWHTVANIHRKSGTSRLNSRISELRGHGYVIEHETVPHKTGSLGHRYRLLNPPSQTELATLVDLGIPDGSSLPRREVPRDSTHRYRIYRMVYDVLDLIATASSAEDVGVALITLGSEGVFKDSCVGCLDTFGNEENPGQWILNPWEQQGT